MHDHKYVTKLDKKPAPSPLKLQPLAVAKYLNVGYYVIIPLLGAVAAGVGLDRYFATKPFFTVVLIVFGAVSSLYNMVRLMRDIKQENVTHKH